MIMDKSQYRKVNHPKNAEDSNKKLELGVSLIVKRVDSIQELESNYRYEIFVQSRISS